MLARFALVAFTLGVLAGCAGGSSSSEIERATVSSVLEAGGIVDIAGEAGIAVVTVPGSDVCVVEFNSGVSRFCIDDPQVLDSAGSVEFSPDGSLMTAVSSAYRSQLHLIDATDGATQLIFGDGEYVEDEDDVVETGLRGVFTPSGDRIITRRITSSWNSQRHDLVLYDVTEGAIVSSMKLLDTGTDNEWEEAILSASPALDIDERTIQMIDEDEDGQLVLAEFDIQEGTSRSIAELPDRTVIAEPLDENRMLLQVGASHRILDLQDGSITTLLAPDATTEPFFFRLIDAGDGRLIVSWSDRDRPISGTNTLVLSLSLLDLASEELPVDVRSLPVLWDADTKETALKHEQLLGLEAMGQLGPEQTWPFSPITGGVKVLDFSAALASD